MDLFWQFIKLQVDIVNTAILCAQDKPVMNRLDHLKSMQGTYIAISLADWLRMQCYMSLLCCHLLGV